MEKSIREEIKAYYGGIAKNIKRSPQASCGCGTSCCGDLPKETVLYSENFLEGIPTEAINASLGCANPLVVANLKPGEIVLDLGSGGGIDVLVASKLVGDTGKVFGLDMTDEMLELANLNKEKSGAKNVAFIKGYIEDIPMEDEAVDVVTSNCVINLSESKEDALREAYRILKKGGRIAIADIIELKHVSNEIRESIQMWVGCIAGALTIEEYQRMLREVGFKDIEITPSTIYSKEMLRDIAASKNLIELYHQMNEYEIDGAYAGALIKASK